MKNAKNSTAKVLSEQQVRDILDAFEGLRMLHSRMPALPKGITSRHLRVIDQIERLGRKGPVRVSDVSDVLHVTRPGITKVVNELTEQKYVIKDSDPEDSRLVLLSLTDDGRDIYETYVRGYQSKLAECWGKVPDKDIRTMLSTMQELLGLMP